MSAITATGAATTCSSGFSTPAPTCTGSRTAQVIERHSQDEGQWVRELTARATPDKSAEWSRGSPAEWANDSLEAANVLYRRPESQELLKPGEQLGDEYFRLALPIVRPQMARAGVRLAQMLNQIYR